MLIATSLAVALCASSAVVHAGAAAAPATPSTPPMIINVSAPGISPSLLRLMLAETDAIWRGSGVSFVWRRTAREAAPESRAGQAAPYLPATLRVIVGDDPGAAHDGQLPLGWIVFDDVTTPEQEVYVSYANAVQFILSARSVVGIVEQMPSAQREWLLGRAMGRALAHELGHYLLASKTHTVRGLMKASRTASEFFSEDNRAFAIEPAQRQLMVARLRGESLVASW